MSTKKYEKKIDALSKDTINNMKTDFIEYRTELPSRYY